MKKFISLNVNGIRAVMGRGFLDFVAKTKPDALCLQEVKALPEQVELALRGYTAFWNPAEKKGYSGTMTLVKKPPISVKRGIPRPGGKGREVADHDPEGRVLTLEYNDFYLVNVYSPNSRRELERLPFRMEWEDQFFGYLKTLERAGKPVIFCGDLNVAHREIDLANPKTNKRNAGFTVEERQKFERLLTSGFVDTFREFEPGGGHYTWWSQRPGIRERNIGWRIDYFCISHSLRPRLRSAGILGAVLGSDHCPVTMKLI